jgi:hypothetical protein
MAGHVDVRDQSKFVQFKLSGDESLDFALSYWRRVGDECGRKGQKKAMVINNLRGSLSSIDMNELSSRVSGHLRGLKIALVCRGSQDYARQLADIVSRRTGSKINIFPGETQAEQWLERG